MDEVSVVPLYDTWEVVEYAGAWILEPDSKDLPPVQERNSWFAAALEKTLTAFHGFARPWKGYFDPIDRQSAASVEAVWPVTMDNASFIQELLGKIRSYPQPVASVVVDLEESVFVRTPESSDKPVRAWVRLPSDLSVNIKNPPYIAYNRSDSLFWPSSSRWIDNRELYTLNQPLLERALRRWEELLGPITDVDGPEGIYRYGYRLAS